VQAKGHAALHLELDLNRAMWALLKDEISECINRIRAKMIKIDWRGGFSVEPCHKDQGCPDKGTLAGIVLPEDQRNGQDFKFLPVTKTTIVLDGKPM
jgi:hypothetical protein